MTVCSGVARLEAQVFNSVPLNHPAYDIIAMGVMRGVISPPPSVKPWSALTITAKLWELVDDPEQILTIKEEETIIRALDSLERSMGLEILDGRYWTDGDGYTLEAGLGWESVFSVAAPGGMISSVNTAKIYAGGDIADFTSWNLTALGEFLYIERTGQGRIPAVFPHTFSKQWDGGVLSLAHPGVYAGWPDDPSFAGALEGEFNGVFDNQRLQLRLGRVRHDWGHGYTGASLFLNSHARPFIALEGTWLPFYWLNVSLLSGALERFRDDDFSGNEGPFTNILTAAQVEFNPFKYVYFDIGAAAVLVNRPDAAFFADMEIRLPGMFSLWGSIFVDHLNTSSRKFSEESGNSYAAQAGIRTSINWLPHAVFMLRYTKVEPYCYARFTNGGESLGYYMPPNSDELLFRFETMLYPDVKTYVQFQMIRQGVDFGHGAVAGSSPRDSLDDFYSPKYFLLDGVYQWDNIIKLGASVNLKAADVPLLIFAETGFVFSSFTINGDAGIGNKGNYEPFVDQVYKYVNNFLFSIGLRVFP